MSTLRSLNTSSILRPFQNLCLGVSAVLSCCVFGPTLGLPFILHGAMVPDANIIDIFGEPPEGLDLQEYNLWRSEVGLIVLICVAIVSVALRYAARTLQRAGFKADDYFMILGLVGLSPSKPRIALIGKSSNGGLFQGLSVGTSILVAVCKLSPVPGQSLSTGRKKIKSRGS